MTIYAPSCGEKVGIDCPIMGIYAPLCGEKVGIDWPSNYCLLHQKRRPRWMRTSRLDVDLEFWCWNATLRYAYWRATRPSRLVQNATLVSHLLRWDICVWVETRPSRRHKALGPHLGLKRDLHIWQRMRGLHLGWNVTLLFGMKPAPKA